MSDLLNIFSQTRLEIRDFLYNDIEVVPGYYFNQYETIKRCHLYDNSQFQYKGLYNGRERMFFNICKFRREVASRALQFQTSDIRLLPLNRESRLGTFLMEKELKTYLKRSKYGQMLEELPDWIATFGTGVVRKNKKGSVIVDLRRMYNDSTVKTLKGSRFLTFKHYLTRKQLLDKVKDGWDDNAVKKAIRTLGGNTPAPTSYEAESMSGAQVNQIVSSPYYKAYERFGEARMCDLDPKSRSEDPVSALFIMTASDSFMDPNFGLLPDQVAPNEEGIVLFKARWNKDWPVDEFHLGRTPGRWLGIGTIEDLFVPQERFNEIKNQTRVSMEISALHLFQSDDETIINSVLSDLETGQVLKKAVGSEGLRPVDVAERNMAAQEAELRDYDASADRIAFTPELARGETPPPSTPATSATLAQQNVNSISAKRKRRIAEALRAHFNEQVAPQLKSDLSYDHVIRFMGSLEDFTEFDELWADTLVRQEIIDRILAGKVVTAEERDTLMQEIKTKIKAIGPYRWPKIKEKFYYDMEFEFDFIVDEEQENLMQAANNIFRILAGFIQNPQVLDDPRIKVLYYKYCEKLGIDPLEIEAAELKAPKQPAGMPMPGMGPMGAKQPAPAAAAQMAAKLTQ